MTQLLRSPRLSQFRHQTECRFFQEADAFCIPLGPLVDFGRSPGNRSVSPWSRAHGCRVPGRAMLRA